MKTTSFICAFFMIASEMVSLLMSTSHGGSIYSAIGIDIVYIQAECAKIVALSDINQCYIDGMKAITYITRWPYVIAYVTLCLLSFYSVKSYLVCVTMSFLFMVYGFTVDGFNTVAPWVNLFVLLICASQARRIIYGTQNI
jgi:hypothetical protein